MIHSSNDRRASCRCGQLSVSAAGEPVRVSICHCLACKQRSGSAFSYQARFPRSNMTFEGASKQFIRMADSGNRLVYHFCPDCGSTVYYYLESGPDLVAIPVGGFADPHFPQPKFSVYEARKNDWVQIPEFLEHSD
jgi:hypothetical protein